MIVSAYKLGNRENKWSRINWGLVRAAELSADNASRRTVLYNNKRAITFIYVV